MRGARPIDVLTRLGGPWLEHVAFDPAFATAGRTAAACGGVVHVLPHVSLPDLVALVERSRRLGLPEIAFANELGGMVSGPFGAPRDDEEAVRALGAALDAGLAAVLFLRRDPGLVMRAGAGHRASRSGARLLEAIVERERAGRPPVTLLPGTFVWRKTPDRLRFSFTDLIFGTADVPGGARAALEFVRHHKGGVYRLAEPLRLGDFLRREAPDVGVETVGRRVTYALLRRVDRERRAALGPREKPRERLREEVLRSPKLQAILKDLAGAGTAERERLTDKARAMLVELEASPEPQTLRALEAVADELVERVYAGVDVDTEGLEGVRAAAREGTLVFLPSHKSHVDYLLLSYVLRKHALATPLVAAGDNLAFFPLGAVFRRAGAFFIRRNFHGDRIYTAVVDAYVRRLLRDGHPLEFFLEGGRSRTGKLLAPKLGLLNMVVDSALGLDGRRVFFVPVAIAYERTMEDASYAGELLGAPKRREDVRSLLEVGGVLLQRYGRANVQFGRPLELADVVARVHGAGRSPGALVPAKRRAVVNRLAHDVMREINRVTAVTPGALVATALLCHPGRGLPHRDLVAQCERLLALCWRWGARLSPTLAGRPPAPAPDVDRGPSSGRTRAPELRGAVVREAALVYVRGGLLGEHVPGDTLRGLARRRRRVYSGDDVIYTVAEDKRLLLDNAKNHVVHLFVDRALVATALLSTAGEEGVPRAEVEARAVSLATLFAYEFVLRGDRDPKEAVDATLQAMAFDQEIELAGAVVRPGLGHTGRGGRAWLYFYGAVLRNFVEAYRIAARTTQVLLGGPLPRKDLVARALRVGEQMYLGGELERSEAVNSAAIENAFASFLDQGYLRRAGTDLALAESFADADSARTLEARIAGYLAWRSAEGGL